MQNKDTNLENAKQNFNGIIKKLETMSDAGKSLHTVEYLIFKTLIKLGKSLLLYYINLLLPISETEFRENNSHKKIASKGIKKRTIFTIFGLISFERTKFYLKAEKKIYYPLDRLLKLQSGKFSYRIQDWVSFGASDQDFRSSVSLLNRIFSYDLSGMQSERIASISSRKVDDFYEYAKFEEKTEGQIFAVGFDDKGVPIKGSDINREQDSKAVRLGKGQKKGVKKNCTVSVGYSFDAKKRTAADIVDNLFREVKLEKSDDKTTENSKWAQNKHIRGFMSGKEDAINYGFDNILDRKKEKDAKIVVLIDGDRGLENIVNQVAEQKKIKSSIVAVILDFIHVTEYLWKAGNAYFGEKNPERIAWVKKQCLLILQSNLTEVIESINNFMAEYENNLTKTKIFQKVLTYFKNHAHMMDYDKYLEQGFPIATGAIESACGHFVQSRMGKNGMRWSMSGAQKILNLRAINKNDDWEFYMQYYIKKDQEEIQEIYKMVA